MSAHDFLIENLILKKYRGDAETVAVPDGVTEIGERAFEKCESLHTLLLPDSVSEIAERAFLECKNLKELVLPQGVVSIGEAAFSDCSRLRRVVLPTSVRTIGDLAFLHCNALCELTLNEGLESIGNHAFTGCDKIGRLTIPSTVKSFGLGAFNRFHEFRALSFAFDPTYTPDAKKVLRMFNDIDLLIAFLDDEIGAPPPLHKELLRYLISKPIRTELFHTFLYTGDAERTAALLSRVRKLSVDELDGYIELAKDAATRLLLLQYKNERYTAEQLAQMDADRIDKEFGLVEKTLADHRRLFSVGRRKDGTYQISEYKGRDGNLQIPGIIEGHTVSIKGHAFYNDASIETVQIESGVTEIGDRAFFGCTALRRASLPDTVTRIGKAAFSHCEELEEIEIPDSVTVIEESAFEHCLKLRHVRFGKGLRQLGHAAFRVCTTLEAVTFYGGLQSVPTHAFYGCEGLTEITLPDTVAMIGTAPLPIARG